MFPRLFIILILSVALVSGCGQRQEKRLPPPPIKVGASTVDRGDLEQTLDVSGNLQFIGNTVVSSEVAARVKTRAVRDGQPVLQGQILLTFDDSSIRAAADQARGNLQKDQATLAFSKAEWEKNLPLLKSGAISQSTYDQKFSAYQNSMGQVDADKGALAKALEDFDHTVVKAPITGLLTARYVEIGDWVAVGGKLFQISDYTTVYLQAFMTDKDVGKLNISEVIQSGNGTDAEITVDPYPGRTFTGKVGYIQPTTDLNRLFEVRIYVPNPDMKLLQGMFARGRMIAKRIKNVVRVPVGALLERIRNDETNTVVRVDKDEKAELVQIKVGALDALYAEVQEGLGPGDRVVVEGKEILSSGQPLQVVGASPRAS